MRLDVTESCSRNSAYVHPLRRFRMWLELNHPPESIAARREVRCHAQCQLALDKRGWRKRHRTRPNGSRTMPLPPAALIEGELTLSVTPHLPASGDGLRRVEE